MKPRRINVHIDRLVIDSRIGVDSKRFGRTLRTDLARRFENQPLPTSMRISTEIRSLQAGTVPLQPAMPAQRIAQGVAQRIGRSMGLSS